MDQRFTPPTSRDVAAYKSIMKVYNTLEDWNYYIQIARSDDKPEWIRIGVFLEKAFANYIENKEFIDECLRLFELKKDAPFAHISKIIKEQG